jgi:arsenate reductase (glutaredoxin)
MKSYRLAAMPDEVAAALDATLRALSEDGKADIDRAKALRLMEANPSLIRRPVIEHAGGVPVGFDAGTWEAALTDGSRQ